jgi:SAM-dependent methyltransferase
MIRLDDKPHIPLMSQDEAGACEGMDGDIDRERALVTSWSTNASPWADAVRSNAIASRRLITDRAVLQAVLRHQPASVLDLGCGEGWLSRRLAERVGHVVGIDISPELIAQANEAGGATFHEMGFDALIRNRRGPGTTLMSRLPISPCSAPACNLCSPRSARSSAPAAR